ncbi:hypothetical protein K7957_14105 [Sphingomonas yunnanensis]|uniref:hypothetical protein n=1 Tax=Sphingomonas yunnanensis TaxID=310400 RepID=UPI001CA6C638|nr:hypothetical protein [Sphingomonas yunnanensis]MBY9064072.1 hypothetical protein [Sphingomonas yunnanensis]
MTDPRLPSRRAPRVLAILALFVAAMWIIVFVGENVASHHSLERQRRAGEPGGAPRRPQP